MKCNMRFTIFLFLYSCGIFANQQSKLPSMDLLNSVTEKQLYVDVPTVPNQFNFNIVDYSKLKTIHNLDINQLEVYTQTDASSTHASKLDQKNKFLLEVFSKADNIELKYQILRVTFKQLNYYTEVHNHKAIVSTVEVMIQKLHNSKIKNSRVIIDLILDELSKIKFTQDIVNNVFGLIIGEFINMDLNQVDLSYALNQILDQCATFTIGDILATVERVGSMSKPSRFVIVKAQILLLLLNDKPRCYLTNEYQGYLEELPPSEQKQIEEFEQYYLGKHEPIPQKEEASEEQRAGDRVGLIKSLGKDDAENHLKKQYFQAETVNTPVILQSAHVPQYGATNKKTKACCACSFYHK